MNFPLNGRMNEILALTRAGKLEEATALIQRSLGSEGYSQWGRYAQPAAPVDVGVGGPLSLPAPGIVSNRHVSPQQEHDSGEGMRRCRHATPHGGLDYLLYIPSRPDEALPLVVMLHGCTQSATDFARGTQMNELAEELGFVVAYPEQTASGNAQKCWNWFRSSDQAKGRGEPALIAGITREIIANHRIDPARVYVAGLSAGGAAAAIMADAYPDLYAAAGVHSGLACGSAKDLPSAFAAMSGKGARRSRGSRTYVPVITFHGDRDKTVHPANSEQIHDVWASAPEIASLERKINDGVSAAGRRYRKISLVDGTGRSFAENWKIMGAGHAWAGGSPAGSYTDSSGPDASREMLRFFFQHRLPIDHSTTLHMDVSN